VLCAAFLWLWLGFVIFWHRNIAAKAARKMLVKLTTGCMMRLKTEISILPTLKVEL
jgi:hypothetical protein